jgi:predicted GNAT superfamily acetyltransferase
MAGPPLRRDGRGVIEIAEPTRDQLVPAARLLGDVLGFAPADAIPAWLMLTAAESGGLLLVACSGDEVVGASFALRGEDELFSCGLAIAPAFRRRGIARALKLEQRRQALLRGVPVIRWTADPLNGPGLVLYLSGLGARLTAYRTELYDGLRAGDGVPQDDVEIEWRLAGGPVRAAAGDEVVRLPVNGDRLERRLRVREAMSAVLAGGAVGVAAEPCDGGFLVRFAR